MLRRRLFNDDGYETFVLRRRCYDCLFDVIHFFDGNYFFDTFKFVDIFSDDWNDTFFLLWGLALVQWDLHLTAVQL